MLHASKGMAARDERDHFRLVETLTRERSGMALEVLERLRYSRSVRGRGVDTSSAKVHLRPRAIRTEKLAGSNDACDTREGPTIARPLASERWLSDRPLAKESSILNHDIEGKVEYARET